MRYVTLRHILIPVFSLLLIGGLGENAKAQEGFEEWKENYLNEFEEFQNEYDKQFHEMLQKEWKEFDIELSPDFYEKPKPNTIPRIEKEEKPDSADTVEPAESRKEIEEEKEKQETAKSTKPKAEQKEEKEAEKGEETKEKEDNRTVDKKERSPSGPSAGIAPTFEPEVKKAEVHTKNLSYFDTPIRYKYYAAYETRLDRPVDKKAISDFWKHLSTKDYPSFLEQIEQVRSELSLNDYGYAQLLENIGEQIYGENTHEATLFTWFMLTQSDFGTRIAYNKDNVYLLIKTTPGVFKTTYFTINGSKYYGLSFSESHSQLPSKLYTYEGDYPKSEEKELNLYFTQLPTLPEKHQSRTLEFTYDGNTHTIEVPVDQQMIDYFKIYPKANLELYFTSRMEGETHNQLLSQLRPIVEGKSNLEKTNILLRFVQEAFEYQTDQEQFNTEKKMFPSETLYYPASDCDDRSILFAYLLDELTDLEYVVVRYPGHLTPAVHFPSDPPAGDRVEAPLTYNGKSYYVTDPTYVGADAGMVMTKYQNVQPKEIFKF